MSDVQREGGVSDVQRGVVMFKGRGSDVHREGE